MSVKQRNINGTVCIPYEVQTRVHEQERQHRTDTMSVTDHAESVLQLPF